jgi:hypothetical protein
MAVKLVATKPGLEDPALAAVEARLGVRFPDDYRQFLLTHDGARPETNEFGIPGTKGGSGVNDFLSLAQVVAEKERRRERVPPNAWPVAYAEGGNLVCLVIGERAGVYFWNHELEAEEGEPATWDNMYLLAKTFAELLERIRKFDVNDIELKLDQVKHAWIDPSLLKF